MELQWPLILFTTLTAWACGVFGCQGVLALKGAGKKSQQLLAVVSCVLLALGGIAVFFHLQHWERIFNGFGHITSGITCGFIAIVVFVGDRGGLLCDGLQVRGRRHAAEVDGFFGWRSSSSVVLAAVCAHCIRHTPGVEPVLEVLSIVGAASPARPRDGRCWRLRARTSEPGRAGFVGPPAIGAVHGSLRHVR